MNIEYCQWDPSGNRQALWIVQHTDDFDLTVFLWSPVDRTSQEEGVGYKDLLHDVTDSHGHWQFLGKDFSFQKSRETVTLP